MLVGVMAAVMGACEPGVMGVGGAYAISELRLESGASVSGAGTVYSLVLVPVGGGCCGCGGRRRKEMTR